MAAQSAIIWPEKYLPGTTDNFVSNEVIVKDISAQQIWALLSDISKWGSYYYNVSQITPPSSGPNLKKGDSFKFSTFGLPVLTCPVEESKPPSNDQPGRIAWSFALGDEVSGYHAWLVEDLSGGRVRVLTQETQVGKPAVELREKKPNRMLLGHQDWLEGLIKAARGEKIGQTNLGVTEGSG
jgi:hypothetical protein